jgi:hypothetical protein
MYIENEDGMMLGKERAYDFSELVQGKNSPWRMYLWMRKGKVRTFGTALSNLLISDA